MNVHKLGKQYQISYRCPNYPGIINERFRTEEEAKLRAAQVELERKQGVLLPPPHLVDPHYNPDLYRETITVRQLMDEYVSLYGLNHWGEATLSCNLHRIRHYILPYLGDVPLKRLTTHRLECFYRQLQQEPAVKMKGREQEERTISPSVIEKVHAILRSALNQALRWDYLRGRNPALAVELPRHKKGKRDAWTEEEALHALNVCADPILKLCIYLALGFSMRIGEILGLTWDCVHMAEDEIARDDAWLYVEKELRRCDRSCLERLKSQGRDDIFFTFPECKQNPGSTVLTLKTPKTESSVRRIYLPDAVSHELRARKMAQEALKADLAGEYQDFGLVIAHPNGRPYEERQIARKFRLLIQEHELKPVVFHSLRHSSTTLKLKISGGDIKSVQGDTGHAVSDMVTDVYSHIFDADRKHLAKMVNDQFFAALNPEETKKAAAAPAMDPATAKAMQLLKDSPELASAILNMAQLFSQSGK